MSDDQYKRTMELQRQAFEAQFGSLEDMGFEDKTKTEESMETDEKSQSGSDDGGISDDGELVYGRDDGDERESDDDLRCFEPDGEFQGFDQPQETVPKPTVIKFTDTTRSHTELTKAEKRLLKSGKAPSAKPKLMDSKPNQPKTKQDEEDIHNDLELQRFLKESHILSNFQNESSGAELTLQTIDNDGAIGKARRYTLDSRLKSVSEINRVKNQRLEKMPMGMRKGMVKSRQEKIRKFEDEAKDGGIILSKVKKGEFRNIGQGSLSISGRIGSGIKKDMKKTYRQKGLKINSIGRSTRNGLVISQKDIDRINGAGAKGKKGGKNGKRKKSPHD